MDVSDALYKIGLNVENILKKLSRAVKSFISPTPSEDPPFFKLSIMIKRKDFTIHELISLHLQLYFILYLVVNFVIVFLTSSPAYLFVISVPYFLYLRYFLVSYGNFLIDDRPYRVFYYGISAISFFAFLGYFLLKIISPAVYYYYAYVILVALVVLAFRHYFKARFGRDYTYGTIEDVKGDLVRVFIHDDIAANVKPGLYWVPAVEEAEPGRIVKVLVEDRAFRSAKPVRIIEVYLSQSSQSSTEPKNATE